MKVSALVCWPRPSWTPSMVCPPAGEGKRAWALLLAYLGLLFCKLHWNLEKSLTAKYWTNTSLPSIDK